MLNLEKNFELLSDIVNKIVSDNSGGVKMTELVGCLYSYREIREMDLDPEDIEDLIAKIPNLGILKYAMDMSSDLQREKTFIFNKLK